MRDRSNSGEVDDSEAGNVLFELWRLGRAANALLAATLAEMGMTGDEFGIYSVLGCSQRGLSPTALARWMSAPPTTVSSHIKRLETRGHVARHPDPDDRRSYLLRLTPAGRRTLRRSTATYDPMLESVQRQLGADEPSIRAALVTLRHAIDTEYGTADHLRH
jgi:DNA-binding MarR family transcriptional regulator